MLLEAGAGFFDASLRGGAELERARLVEFGAGEVDVGAGLVEVLVVRAAAGVGVFCDV